MKYPYGQRGSVAYGSVYCLGFAIVASEVPFLSRIGRCRRGAKAVGFEKSGDLFFRKIGAFRMEKRFRNAPAVSEDHQIKVPILVVKDAHRPIVTQTSLGDGAI